MTPTYDNWSIPELLHGYQAILDELLKRKVIRTLNSPAGDYAEWLAVQVLGLNLTANSMAGYDASEVIDGKEIKYQIKARRLSVNNRSLQLGALRKLEERAFDFLLAVIFEPDFRISLIAKIPHEIIHTYAPYVERTNSYRLDLGKGILEDERVEKLTEQFRTASNPFYTTIDNGILPSSPSESGAGLSGSSA